MGMSRSEAGKLGAIAGKDINKRLYEERLRLYSLNPHLCAECNRVIPYNIKNNTFCTRSCAAIFHNRSRIKIVSCPVCKKPITNWGTTTCSRKCHKELQYQRLISKWKSGLVAGHNTNQVVTSWVKRYLREKYQNRCCKCNWATVNPYTGIVPLQANHIDGNANNSFENNLELICPNCHSLTQSFMGGNRGKGRASRRKVVPQSSAHIRERAPF